MERIFGANGSRAEDGVPDMTVLSDIDETAINHNLRVRYLHDRIYTYTGSILIAVNPYKELEMYGPEAIMRYQGKKLLEEEPHVFAISESSFVALQRLDKNQSCVISGESGAGKTETTKFILQYLCSVTTGVSTWVEQQIIEANTILEAFGNAKTVRNDNSSRFGKFMQVCFDPSWHIKGCVMQDYLLEQSRITFQGPEERNYHVFYQLVAAAQNNKELAEQFHLKPANTYTYLNQSGCIVIDGIDDARRFDSLRLAFNVLHVPQEICDGIYGTLAAILWLGNLEFADIDGENCELTEKDKEVLKTLSTLLGLSDEQLLGCLLQRQINIRGNITHIPLKHAEAKENRHAMAKTLYSRTFAWLVDHINKCTNPGQDQTRFLGVLDIFGFENFAVNSFEQLCINYTNEKLHKFFNHYVFALEQEIYRQEEIKFSHITFTDNTECLELLEKPPRCLLKLLSEECRMPKGADKTYLTKLHQEFESHPNYIKGDDRRRWEVEFGVNHYAGKVIYTVQGFVDKNRDAQQDVFFDLMSKSENKFIADLTRFQDLLGCTIARMGTIQSTISRGTSKGKPTVSDAFRNQLQALVDVLQATNPWYVRCIKPNKNKAANSYDESMVLDQLRYLGMNDIIRIRKEGFPIHMTFDDFIARYFCLNRRKRYPDPKQHVCDIMKSLSLPPKEWQVGKSKVFIRQKVYEPLEDRRQTTIVAAAIKIQALYRMHRHRKEYQRIHAACLMVQNYYRGWKLRLQFIRKRRAIIIIQSNVRGMFAREVANALREMKRIEEEQRRRERLEEERRQREEEAQKMAAEDEAKKQELEEAQSQQYDGLAAVGEGKVEEELATLSNIADTVNPHLAASMTTNPDDASQGSGEGVDLDNLFSFLSNMESERHVLDEIHRQMDDLTDTFDVEIKALNQRDEDEKREGSLPPPPGSDILDLSQLPPPPGEQPLPPPPAVVLHPPALPGGESAPTQPPQENGETLPPPPPQVNGFHEEEKPKEPIYETIPVGLSGAQTRREPNYVSGPPPAGPPPAPPEEAVELRRPREAAPPPHWDASGEQRRRKPSGQRRTSRSPSAHSPCPTRPSTRSPAPRANSRNNGVVEDPERVERRKQRVERKLHELEELGENKENENQNHFDMIEFAEKFFNNHERSPEGTLMSTLTRKRSTAEYLPKYELITYSRASIIPTSHVHLYDPENITLACTIFRDLCKYCRGELKPDQEIVTIQTIIGHGLEREELRNEIFVQCMRQVTNNPSTESLERLWLMLCLCVVAFQPSKLLHKYFVSFLQKNLSLEGKLKQYVQWCLENCKNTKVSSRQLPPSSVEIAAMKKLGTIVCRFFFLDGRTKAIDVHPRDTAGDAMQKLADRLGLSGLEGWAIYESGSEGDKHVKSHEYLYDVISSWEIKQQKATGSGTHSSSTKRTSQTVSAGENRFVFRKRLFRNPREIPSDPVQVNLLYAQAVYSVVRADDFPINEKVALQLAGLQAQVALGDPQDGKTEFYADVQLYLPNRIAQTKKQAEWVPILAQAHKQYGTGKTDIVAKVWYLTCVMQFPLYGTTMFQVSYRGYWSYGNTLILGVNCDGIAMIKPDDKFILYEYRYCDIESIFLDPSDNFITINLLRTLPDAHKCFVFETKEKQEIGFLIASYSPLLASWIKDMDSNKKVKQITGEDRARLYYHLVHSRRQIIDSNMLKKPVDQGGNFIVSTLRRLNKQKLDKLRQDYGENSETYKGFHHMFWAFSKTPLTQTISKIPSPEVEQQALQISLAILTYAGLNPNAETAATSDDQQLNMVQGIVEQCMKRDILLNETYLQLIKQTTDHPDPNSRVNLRHWSLLTLFCSVIPPTDKNVRKYLRAHLQRCSTDYVSEEGKYARYAEKCLLKALNNRRRQWTPSKQEILCTINRRPIYARFHFMDGQFHSLEFDASATAGDVVELIRHKIGLKDTAKGYAIYEMLGTTERCIPMEEVLADVMSRWERYRLSSAASLHQHHHIFLFKKHLLLESWMDLTDNVEKELLYFQVLYTLRADKFPVKQVEAVMLCALRAQIELGNFTGANMDYGEVIAHTLSPRLLSSVTHEAVAMHHQSLFNMDSQEAKQAFLNLIKSWPLHRATIFDVTQSFTSNWPKVLWLAIDENGVHLLEHRSRNVLCTYEYDYILNYSASITSLMIITGSTRKQSKIILNTTQAFMIATLIKDYAEVLRDAIGSTTVTSGPPSGLMAIPVAQDGAPPPEPRRSRPPSIMARPPPTLTEEVVTQ
ncbi:unconventional myosin-X-like isoform X2 [Portunus trituberculatus]|uniref:unconventional myosin-X-like isoform X2 n=1 Tax=Portunus trituberculatus TaxID=210409 RepID=UPI001E1D0ACC|nr:unconventional myosin-X-like isoform X2 [Portunus trituberculatus]